MNSVEITATEPQAEFYAMNCKYPAFVAGFGSGKSEALINSALFDSMEGGSDSLIALYEPTVDLIKLILIERMEEKFSEWGIRYRYHKTDKIFYTSSGQMGDFVLRSLDNPGRIVGYESFRAKIDELDTLKAEHASHCWTKIVARNRQRPSSYKPTSDKPANTVSVFTTPEGFRFVYDRWVKHKSEHFDLVQARTLSNPYLPDDYVDSLRASYPPQLIDAYLNGQFVNLTSGSIYNQFDRVLNHSDEELKDSEPVFVGMDFNVGKMCAKIHVKRNGNPIMVAEIDGAYDTPDICRILKERLWKYESGVFKKTRDVRIFPDASGGSRKSVNASATDIQILKDNGFVVRAPKANPPVKDRINAVNAMLCNAEGQRRYLINTNLCPNAADSLEQQAWDKNGEPDKEGDFDHSNDALGYFLHHDYPIIKRTVTTTAIGGL